MPELCTLFLGLCLSGSAQSEVARESQKVRCSEIRLGQSQLVVRLENELEAASPSGTVRDTAGYPIPGVTVELLRSQTDTCVEVRIADSNGFFHFQRARNSRYRLRLSKPGFNTLLVDVRANRNSRKPLDLRLPLSN